MRAEIVPFGHDAPDQRPETGIGEEIAREEERALPFVPGQFVEDGFSAFRIAMPGEHDRQSPS